MSESYSDFIRQQQSSDERVTHFCNFSKMETLRDLRSKDSEPCMLESSRSMTLIVESNLHCKTPESSLLSILLLPTCG